MRMNDIRAEWLATIQRYQLSPHRPDNDRFWCSRLDTASQDELRAMQSEKLRVAVRYAYECIPFYRRKFDRIGLSPGDIRSLDDLHLIPVTTKQEMADDLAEHRPR
jgi:phenylacetate-CoA ligase